MIIQKLLKGHALQAVGIFGQISEVILNNLWVNAFIKTLLVIQRNDVTVGFPFHLSVLKERKHTGLRTLDIDVNL